MFASPAAAPGDASGLLTSARTTAARASKVRIPVFISRWTWIPGRRGRSRAPPRHRRARPPAAPPATTTPRAARQARRPGLHHHEDVEPRRQRHVEGVPDPVRVAPLGDPDLDVLRLAGGAGGCGVRVGDPRVRAEPRGVGHRHLGAPERALERPLEVTAAGEPQPAALGVPQAQALDGGFGGGPSGWRATPPLCRPRRRPPVSGPAAPVPGPRRRRCQGSHRRREQRRRRGRPGRPGSGAVRGRRLRRR